MATEGQSGEDKTEAPTTRHIDQARDAGNVPVSRELVGLFSLAAAFATISIHGSGSVRNLVPALRSFLAGASDERLLGSGWLRSAIADAAFLVVPVLLAAAIAGSVSVLLQTGFLLRLEALQPKLSRVDPAAGIRRIFGVQGIVELFKSILKMTLICVAMAFVIGGDFGGFIRMPAQDVRPISGILWNFGFKILAAGLAVQAAIAAIDIGWVRFKHARDLRMSKQDVRDELKETEGNPQVKARLRRVRMSRARKHMMSKVPTATVVVTNPTHYAIALAYDREVNPAPRVVAKGIDTIAARIRDVARANGVPIVPNPSLARALYRLELESEIPAEHFKAVAEIIAFVWRLRYRYHN